jgi:enamine deaminase RidA (YjgF/YER057c/UK114 family)
LPTSETLTPVGAPPPISAYSPALRIDVAQGDVVFTSGQLALEADGTLHAPGDAGAQAVRCFEQIQALVEAAGGSLSDVVKTTVYLSDFADLDAVREARDGLDWGTPPATTAVQVAALLFPEARVEIEAVAVVGRR